MSNSVSPIVVATFERSGTHLVIDFLRRNFPACRLFRLPGERLEMAYVNLDRIGKHPAWPGTIAGARRQMRRGSNPVIKTHTSPDLELFEAGVPRDFASELISRSRIVHVVRDPRKVLASYQLLVDGVAAADPDEFERFLFSAHRRSSETPVEKWFRHLKAWERHPGCCQLRYEDIVRQPDDIRERLAAFLALKPVQLRKPLPPKITSPWQRRMMRVFQFNPSSTAVLGRGKSGGSRPIDWKQMMSGRCRERFHEALGDDLIRLGYEQDGKWTQMAGTES